MNVWMDVWINGQIMMDKWMDRWISDVYKYFH